jgi:hypothetical protein
MSKKKSIIIFPCTTNDKNVKFHYYVVSYFLSKYLKKYFNLIKVGDVENVKDRDKSPFLKNKKTGDEIPYQKEKGNTLSIEFSNFFKHVGMPKQHKSVAHLDAKAQDTGWTKDIDYILTTTQRGFSKLRSKNRNAFNEILELKKKYPKLKLIASHDHSATRKYVEDILLVALPFDEKRRLAVLGGSNTELIYTGWCADHRLFKDNPKKQGDLNIVLDHSALQTFRIDATEMYVEQIKKVKKEHPKKAINLCRIRGGFEFFDFKTNKWTYDTSFRWWRSSHDDGWTNGDTCSIFQIAECLSSSHIFCVTHVESCGLTGIEALMAGCKIYIPSGKDSFKTWGSAAENIEPTTNYYEGPFLKQALLKPYMDYEIFNVSGGRHFFWRIKRDVNNYKLKYNRKMLVKNNSWQAAANTIYRELVHYEYMHKVRESGFGEDYKAYEAYWNNE